MVTLLNDFLYAAVLILLRSSFTSKFPLWPQIWTILTGAYMFRKAAIDFHLNCLQVQNKNIFHSKKNELVSSIMRQLVCSLLLDIYELSAVYPTPPKSKPDKYISKPAAILYTAVLAFSWTVSFYYSHSRHRVRNSLFFFTSLADVLGDGVATFKNIPC